MSKIKVMSVFGTRPEAVKMAPLVLKLGQCPQIESLCCVTAQHREMLDTVLDIFHVKPDFDLDIMEEGQTLSSITTKTLGGLTGVFAQASPDLILVHGDTSTTFAAALAAFYAKIKVGHVEAGLRTFDKYSPYPEEMNRRLTGDIADLHFCPTLQNSENLRRENITDGIFITGNTVIDAMGYTVRPDYPFDLHALGDVDFDRSRVILLTAHRRENYGQPLENIFSAVRGIVERFDDVEVVYPVHPSPAVFNGAHAALGGVPRIHLIAPLPVDAMHNLISRCHLVMTDSGGLQEEAPAMGKPVLVLRRETERPEAVRAGTARLAGVERADIFEMACTLLDSQEEYAKMAHAVNPYGDGQACSRIAQAVLSHFSLGPAPDMFLPKY